MVLLKLEQTYSRKRLQLLTSLVSDTAIDSIVH